MDLILWRHAEAEENAKDDLRRRLTSKGRKQAKRAAEWLLQRLPARFVLVASPALRAHQTAQALGVPIKTDDKLGPGASAKAIIEAVGWPDYKGAVVVVGHQPDLGRTAALLLSGKAAEWSVKKGALWWLTSRERGGGLQVVVRAVLAPDFL